MRHFKKCLTRTSSIFWPCALNHHFKDISKHFCTVIYSQAILSFVGSVRFFFYSKSTYALALVNIDLLRLTGFISLAALSILTSMVKDICSHWSWSPGWLELRHPLNNAHRAPDDTVCPQICRPGWGLRYSTESRANCETVLHMQPRASLLVWAAFGPLSIYTNSLTVSGTTDVSEGGTEHRVFHMKIFKQKELKKIPV